VKVSFELRWIVVSIGLLVVSEVAKRLFPNFFDTDAGARLLYLLTLLAGAVAGGTLGSDHHAVISGLGMAATAIGASEAPRMVMDASRAKKRRRVVERLSLSTKAKRKESP
jgi:hypothetical protein